MGGSVTLLGCSTKNWETPRPGSDEDGYTGVQLALSSHESWCWRWVNNAELMSWQGRYLKQDASNPNSSTRFS
jgi:hypothetical protein